MSVVYTGMKCAKCNKTCTTRENDLQVLCPSCEWISAGTDPQRNWAEDFSHENGTYYCKCCHCDSTFVGHKRRVVCKLCANRPEISAGRLMAYVFGGMAVIVIILVIIISKL